MIDKGNDFVAAKSMPKRTVRGDSRESTARRHSPSSVGNLTGNEKGTDLGSWEIPKIEVKWTGS